MQTPLLAASTGCVNLEGSTELWGKDQCLKPCNITVV
jgi:hypothetical protein